MKSAEVTSLHSSPATVDRVSMPVVARESSEGNYTPTAPALEEPPSVEPPSVKSVWTDRAPGVDEVIRLIRTQMRHDFSACKRVAISRCITLRMQALRAQSAAEYVRVPEKSSVKLHALVRDLLIGVARFFTLPNNESAASQGFEFVMRLPLRLSHVPNGSANHAPY